MRTNRLTLNLGACLLLASTVWVKPVAVAAQETENPEVERAMWESLNDSTRKELENVEDEASSIQSAIKAQEKSLAAQIGEQLPQQEIRAARGIYDTIDAIIDFFGGLSFDDFFGGISLDNILDDVFGSLGGSDSSGDRSGSNASGNTGGIGLPAPGEIGLPDPGQVSESIQASPTSTAEELLGAKTGGNGSVVVKDDINTLFKVNLAKETAEASALSDDAQSKLKKKSETATAALKQSADLAQDSEGQDVSQNILRNISTQQWLQQQTSSILAMNAKIDQRDNAIANSLMAETLREVNGERIAKNRELAATYNGTITRGAQFALPGLIQR